MREAFDYGFRSLASGGAGLDFVSLTDHNTDSAWGEIGFFQRDYPGKLIIRGAEVTTFRGHMMNHGSGRYVDHRTGAVYEGTIAGGRLTGLTLRRPARGASEILREVKRAGGFTQVNHPTIFPSEIPAFANLCRGCSWSYPPEQTGYGSVDGIEVATGPAGFSGQGPNPFTVTAIDFFEQRLAAGFQVAALGVSDSHDAGEVSGPTSSPIGTGSTAVLADELSEPGIECGIEAGRTYAKVTGAAGPDLRFEARPPGWRRAPAVFGDTVRAGTANFTARVLRGAGRTLLVYRDGSVIESVPVVGGRLHPPLLGGRPRPLPPAGPARADHRDGGLADLRAARQRVVTGRDCSPAQRARRRPPAAAPGAKPLPHALHRVGRGPEAVCGEGHDHVRPAGARRILATGRVAMTGGSRRVRLRLTRYGRRVLRRHPKRGRRVRLTFTVDDGDGARPHRPAGRPPAAGTPAIENGGAVVRRLDILFAAEHLVPPVGGAEMSALELLEGLSASGHRVRALWIDGGKPAGWESLAASRRHRGRSGGLPLARGRGLLAGKAPPRAVPWRRRGAGAGARPPRRAADPAARCPGRAWRPPGPSMCRECSCCRATSRCADTPSTRARTALPRATARAAPASARLEPESARRCWSRASRTMPPLARRPPWSRSGPPSRTPSEAGPAVSR